MRGPKPAYPIALTAEEVTQLKLLVQAHTTPQMLAVRAQIILRAHDYPDESNQQIAAACGTTDRTVRTWRGRWVTIHQLADQPRSGAPRRFSPTGARKSWPSPVAYPNSVRSLSRDGVEPS
jgi:hypothetical protein